MPLERERAPSRPRSGAAKSQRAAVPPRRAGQTADAVDPAQKRRINPACERHGHICPLSVDPRRRLAPLAGSLV